MKVYHGGADIIMQPFVGAGRDELDFGKGFYVTDIREQAENWATRLADRREAIPILNVYELDMERVTANYHYKKFGCYNFEWLDFIVSNRQGKTTWKSYDLIEGGVADDRVVDTVEGYIAELISVERALERAFDVFYESTTCERLHDSKDYLYMMGDLYIVDELMLELQHKMSY